VASDTELVLFTAHREALAKYTYFLLTAAGAGIALSVNQTRGAALAWSQIPLAIAVVCWGASFFCGVLHLEYVNASNYDNLELLRVQAGGHPMAGTHPQKIEIGLNVLIEELEKKGSKAAAFGRSQFFLIIAGAVSYVVWHVLEMYLRTGTIALV